MDCGDFGSSLKKSQKLKVKYLLKGMALLKYDAINLGEKDLQYGKDFLLEMRDLYQLPFISANIYDAATGKPFAEPYVIVQSGNRRIGIFGIAKGDATQKVVKAEFAFDVRDPLIAAQSVVSELRDQCDVIVALAHIGLRESYELAEKVEGIDIIISGHAGRHLRSPKQVGKTIVMQPGSQGKYLGQLDFTISGRNISDVQGKTIPLAASIPDDARLTEIIKEFDDELLSAYPMESPQAKASPSKFSERSCRMCHLKEYKQWTSTLHSHAWETLVREKQTHNPECQECHTTMFDESSGFSSIAVTPDLVNVQCAECHRLVGDDLEKHRKRPRAFNSKRETNGSKHIDFVPVTKQTCLKCHNQENSPKFDYTTFLSKVVH